MGFRKDQIRVIVPSDYEYDDDDRNDFIHSFDVGTVTDAQIEKALRNGWAERRY